MHRRSALLSGFLAVLSVILSPTAFAFDPPDVTETELNAVFLVGVAHPDGGFIEVGTAWTIAPNYLATNAHVAQALMEEVGVDGRMVARRGLLDRSELAIGNPVIHPAYDTWNRRLRRMLIGASAQLKNFDVIEVADVAIIEVLAGDAGTPLVCVDCADPVSEPALGEDVMYLGYPAENLSGFTTLHAVSGSITAKTDFFFMRSPWASSHLLHFAGPATGGASGSPVLNSAGHVIGILSAAEHLLINEEGTRASFGFTYAQRVDLAIELLDGTVGENQARRDREWTDRAFQLFAKPAQLIDQLVEIRANFLGMSYDQFQLVTQREDTLTEESKETSIRVLLEPGYAYGFLAVSHDATDIDIHITDRAGEEMAKDTETDQYPVVWLDPVDGREEVWMRVSAYEQLILPTPVSSRIVRMDASLLAQTNDGLPEFMRTPLGERIVEHTYMVETAGQESHEFTFDAEPGMLYTFRAISHDQHDIDLRLYKDGSLLAEDVLVDWYPEVQGSEVTGQLILELIFPSTIPQGAEIIVTVDEMPAQMQ